MSEINNSLKMTRQELITSREFWVAKIHANLWVANGSVEADSDKYEEMAEKIVDARFMDLIKEIEATISENKKLYTT